MKAIYIITCGSLTKTCIGEQSKQQWVAHFEAEYPFLAVQVREQK